MSNGEIAFLALVLCAFATFMGVVGFLSIWTRIPRKPTLGTDVATVQSRGRLKMEGTKEGLASGAARPAQAA